MYHQNVAEPVLLVENHGQPSSVPTPPHRRQSPATNNAISNSGGHNTNNNSNINRQSSNNNSSFDDMTFDDEQERHDGDTRSGTTSSSPFVRNTQVQNNNLMGKTSRNKNYKIVNHIHMGNNNHSSSNNNNNEGDDDAIKYLPSSSNSVKSPPSPSSQQQQKWFNMTPPTRDTESKSESGVEGDSPHSFLNDSSSSSSTYTLELSSSSSPSTSSTALTPSSALLPPIGRPSSSSTSKSSSHGESRRLRNNLQSESPSSPPSEIFHSDNQSYSTPPSFSTGGREQVGHLSQHPSSSKSSSVGGKGQQEGCVPHLTFSPDTPPAGLGTPVVQDFPSTAHFRSSSLPSSSLPSSSSSSNPVFGDLLKMKSTPEASGGSCAVSRLSGLPVDVQKVLLTSSTHHSPGINSNLNSTNNNNSLNSIDNSTANHSHSSSNLSSTEENFECLGEGTESFLDSHSENTSLQYSRDVNDLSVPGDSPGAPPIRRNSWLRTSLRKSPQHQQPDMGHRRWGSFRATGSSTGGSKRPAVTSSSALANQLYRSSSFHSSGRSSAGDGEEMYSDGSLEDEVIDLTQKVHHLEEKFTVLAENQKDEDDRYVRIKQENAELSTKLFMSEESLRELELRAEEKLRDEQRRNKETLARVEREKQLQIENYDIRLRSCEKELETAKNEGLRVKSKCERERAEKLAYQDKVLETERELVTLKEDYRAIMDVLKKERDTYLLEASNSQQALQELRREYESLRSRNHLMDSSNSHSDFRGIHGGHSIRFNSVDSESESAELKSRLHESEEENKLLKKQIRQLQETNEELSAQILNHGLEEGRHLLTVNCGLGDMGNSLAAEFEAMSEEQLQKALTEQTEVNSQLRTYIDGILLNIVENYPQLLEVKNKSSSMRSMGDSSMEQASS